jgi:hypothetical protein
MENEPESITQTRVRLYRKALDQQREENAAKEAEARSAKKPGSETAEGQDEPGSDRADSTAHEDSDRA